MPVLIDTDAFAAAERCEAYRTAIAAQPVPVSLQSPLPAQLRVRQEAGQLGPLTVARVRQVIDGPRIVVRTPRLIRQSDPEIYRVMVNVCGRDATTQAGRETVLGPLDLAMFDSSRPFEVRRLPHDGRRHEFVMVTFPRSLCAVRPEVMRAATSIRLPGTGALGALVHGFARTLARDVDRYQPADALRLATTFLDLLTLWLSRELDTAARVPTNARRQVLLMQVQTYIAAHIADHTMSPVSIAAAHHISPRTLHTLFQAHGLTVAGWIRDHRLEGCRRTLADPHFDDLPIGAIGARWGILDSAWLSRTFRAKYGQSPRMYRQQRQPAAPQSTPAHEYPH